MPMLVCEPKSIVLNTVQPETESAGRKADTKLFTQQTI